MRRLHNLDILRLLLATFVVYLHTVTAIKGQDSVQVLLYPVQAFVAISGYVITASLDRNLKLVPFAFKRILRLGPAFVLSFVLVFLVAGSAAVFEAFRVWYTVGVAGWGVNGPLWTLALEEIFYVLLLVAYFSGPLKTRWGAILFWSFSLFLLTPQGYKWLLSMGIEGPSKYTNIFMAFATGVLLYRLGLRRCHPGVALPILALAMATTAWGFDNPYVRWTGIFFASVAMIAIGTMPQVARVKYDISYGVYIYHYPLLTWLLSYRLPLWQMLPLVIFVTYSVSFASLMLAERPIAALRKLVEREPNAERDLTLASSTA